MKKYDPLYFYESEENSDLIQSIPVRDGNATGADPNKIAPDQKVLYVGTGYQFDQGLTSMYAYG